MATYFSLEDFEKLARKRLPHAIFTYVNGKAGSGRSSSNAEAAYNRLAFVPRIVRDVSGRRQSCELFGKVYSHPFGIAPVGAAALVAYRGDVALADAAQSSDIPMILSASSLIRLEEMRASRPNTWFQAYFSGDEEQIRRMVRRVEAAGFETLVITGDTPVVGNRDQARRAGFSVPLTVTPGLLADALMHPRWLVGVMARTLLAQGMLYVENVDPDRGPAFLSRRVERSYVKRDRLSWDHVKMVRKLWSGNLVLKGLLSADDVELARSAGCDGIIVSNHGGRQLDHGVAPIQVLPGIVDAGREMPVMIDGGIRRGSDVLKALALGAKFVFLGSPFLYAACVGGTDAVRRAIAILSAEIDTDMALLGVSAPADLTPDFLAQA